jgi:fatty acid-binding protein DegV
MIEDLKHVKGPTRTSCPNVHEWSEAFGDADYAFAVTITSNLSGSCSAAMQAASDREHVHVVDTLSAGPEIQLIIKNAIRWAYNPCRIAELSCPHVTKPQD